MSLLGKILLFLNLILAIGVVYLTSQNYGERQSLNTSILRYQIVKDGLPTDDLKGDSSSVQLLDVYGPGDTHSVKPVDKKILEGLFADAQKGSFGGDGVPLSLAAEIKAVYENIKTQAGKENGDAGKVAFLCGVNDARGQFMPKLLMELADTFEERQVLRRLALSPATAMKAAADEAMKRLDRKFLAATSPPNATVWDDEQKTIADLKAKIAAAPKDAGLKAQLTAALAIGGPAACSDELDRRRRCTRLLMLVDPSPAYQKRVALIAGLKTYLSVLTEQVSRLDGMYRSTERGIELDQAAYESQYELLKKYAFEMDQLVTQQERVVESLKGQLADQQNATEKRQTQLNDLKSDLAAFAADVNARLAKQAEIEKALFAVQKKVGEMTRSNGLLEDDLRKKD